MKFVNFNSFVRLACFALILIFMGCSASSMDSDYANLNGTWQNPLTKQKVVLKISGDHKTISIDDKTLPVTIKKVDVDIFTVHVSDKTIGEKDWRLWRVWNDIGDSFTIKLERDGTVESLTHIA